jgi:hypothetical protein
MGIVLDRKAVDDLVIMRRASIGLQGIACAFKIPVDFFLDPAGIIIGCKLKYYSLCSLLMNATGWCRCP